jgi:integrase
VAPVPAAPEVVATFLAAQASSGVKASTLARRAAAIRYAHALKGVEPPTNSEAVKATMRGIRRTLGTKKEQKAAATSERVARMVSLAPATLGGLRDQALLLLGFSGAFRRSELVAIEVSDLLETAEGYRVTIRRSKTDQEGAGHEVAILRGSRLRTVEAVQAWLHAAGITEGPLFRPVAKGGRVLAAALTAESVANIVKAYAKRAGLEPAAFAGHSLRAGFLTSAAEHGASIFKMMEVSRHKSVDVLRGYIRRVELFKEHAGAGFL